MYTKFDKLEWDEKYSVGVKELDLQHQNMFAVINKLMLMIGKEPDTKEIGKVLSQLTAYKEAHFAAEEKFFEECKYEGADEHIKAHRQFSSKVQEIAKKNGDNSIGMAYDLIDFLEDWLVDHILTMDQQYKACVAAYKARL